MFCDAGWETQWLPEIRHFLPSTTPIALVEVGNGQCGVISSEEGEQVARLLHASFIRCRIGSPESAIGELAKAAFQHKNERVKQAAAARQTHITTSVSPRSRFGFT